MTITKNKILSFSFALCIGIGLHAQNLNVLDKSGLNTSISINNIRSLIFSSGNLNVNLKSGSPIIKVISDVQNLNFSLSPTTNIALPPKEINNNLKLFTNSTNGILNITLTTNENSNIDLKIISIDGRIMFTETINGLNINQYKVNASSWQKGLYIVLLNNGKEVISGKIIKN